jgi:DNA polymerase-3 subunit gamma/tau
VTRQVAEPSAQQSPVAAIRGIDGPEDWHRLVSDLTLGGVASQLARNCELCGWNGRRLSLALDPAYGNLRVPIAEERLKEALEVVLGKELELEIRVSAPQRETPAERNGRLRAARRGRAETLMAEDPVVGSLQEELGAHWVPGSIEPTR